MRNGVAAARRTGMSESTLPQPGDAEQDPEAVVFIEDREPQQVLSIRANVAVAELAQAQGERLSELWRSMQPRGLAAVGPPFVRYHTFGETETDVELGMPVSQEATGDGRIQPGALPGGAAIVTWHVGAHDTLGDAYGRLNAWLEEHKREAAGPAWEVYWWIASGEEPDPSSWPAPTQWRTELVQPVASMGGAP
jgi:effector-binding domain-containing protein